MWSWLLLATLGGLAAISWHLSRRLGRIEQGLRDLRLLKREVEEMRADVERSLAVTRTHLALVAAGEPPERNAIIQGKAFTDIQPAPALVLYEQNPDLFVLDVRTQAEYANGHIPRATLIPLDELEDRLRELPAKDTLMLVHCAAGGRSTAACQTLAHHGYTRLVNLAGGLHGWQGPQERTAGAAEPPVAAPTATAISYHGGSVSEAQVVAAIRECYDPEIPINIYDLGLVYGIDIAEAGIAVRMTLTSEGCPSARTIPEDVRRKIAALGQPNVTVDVVWDPPWHPSRISADGKQKLGLT